MNDDQNLNPTNPTTTPSQDPVVVPTTPQLPTDNPVIGANEAVSATEPIKLDEFGVPTNSALSPTPEMSLPVAPPMPQPELPVAPSLPQVPVEQTPIVEQPPVVQQTAVPAPQVGEDLPLAFATPVEAPTPAMSTNAAPPPAPLPPVMPEPKKKEFSIKKLLGIASLVAVIGAVVSGAWYAYLNYAGEDARIAVVTGGVQGGTTKPSSKDACKGCSTQGYEWKWDTTKKECRESKVKCGTDNSGNAIPVSQTPEEQTTRDSCAATGYGTWCESVDSNGKSYAFCIDSRKPVGCNAVAVEKGFTIVYGASVISRSACTNDRENDGQQTCVCGDQTVCFDKEGVCSSGEKPAGEWQDPTVPVNPEAGTGDTTYYNRYGLCATIGSYTSDGNFIPKANYDSCYTCTDAGCSIKNDPSCTATGVNSCMVYHYHCPAGHSGTCVSNPVSGTSANFNHKCGTVEQIDVTCGGKMITSRSTSNPPCATATPKPASPTPTPAVLSCTSLVKDKADSAISIGTKVTLTCAGSVTPTGATSLLYKFRYSINAGAWTSLINKTTTTAELTPSACGTYTAQCQVCGTINGAQVCDPTWTAATVE